MLSLVEDIVVGPDGGPPVHAHAVLGLPVGHTRGGHLMAASVRPSLEVVLTETPAQLKITFRPEFGLALIDIDESRCDPAGNRPGHSGSTA